MHNRTVFLLIQTCSLIVGIAKATQRQKPLLAYAPWNSAKSIETQAQDSGILKLEEWINGQNEFSQKQILANIAPISNDHKAVPGAICASPSRAYPNYYYTWTRDSALTMSEVFEWINSTNEVENVMKDYIQFTEKVQKMNGLQYGLGEAKFNMDGTPFKGSWCNAQTDGPAIRARVVLKYISHLQGQKKDWRRLVDIVKRDLDYVAEVYGQNKHCDIWEEARGLHLYTLLAQRRALVEGVLFMQKVDDKAADKYNHAVKGIEKLLPQFWDDKRGHLLTTVDKSGGIRSKQSNLDAQTMLAGLHYGIDGNDEFGVGSKWMTATVFQLLRVFSSMYTINEVASTEIGGKNIPVGVAIGRYPEDVYDGVGVSSGNPWSLLTSGLAEYHYRLAALFISANSAEVSEELSQLLEWTRNMSGLEVGNFSGEKLVGGSTEFRGLIRYLMEAGDLYMARVSRHTAGDHTMFEQWYKYDGFGHGAIHLTWSYVAHLAASRARSEIVEYLR
ncbi:Six-hairpin glycosidase [Coemansia reversa NRRL 1564]|uniref:glucan 1,4-alpha-glucosidase n=1 Tax=Coemansia reversa (strain ATCC 12441 / NRRL 1564) TaxID=763665 RepID=A0A2G5B3L1_COERN|nr:Six-hairpin glycosidase [Coemansia reversa NRRL 1564]|eukprot:PIA13613.1 Six-hairpin glycosidase [Coemansia reversa NRRL 1564]